MAKRERKTVVNGRSELRQRFVQELRAKVLTASSLQHHSWRKPKGNRCEACKRRIWMNFIAYEGDCRVQVYLERTSETESREIYQDLLKKRAEIEAKCGTLRWKGDDPRHLPTIEMPVTPDEVLDEAQWDAIQRAMIAAMIRFDAALAPYLDRYRAGGVVDLSRNANTQQEVC